VGILSSIFKREKEFIVDSKIDFVLPWVTGDNQEWNEIKKQYLPKKSNDEDATSFARFRDMETLKYVLRSIEQNCPWYHKIYLITKGYHPDWLNIKHPKIVLIREDELFIDKSHLPVFSSVAIEMNLSNIPNLSEQFVYLNDDMLIMQKLSVKRFFIEGKPVDFLSHSFIPRNKIFGIFKKRDTWIHSLNNTLHLINTKFKPIQLDKKYLYHKSYPLSNKINNFLLDTLFKKFIWIEHWHHPQPYLKKTLDDVYHEFKTELMQCSKNRFRDNSDLNQYIYRYWQLAQGFFHPNKYSDAIVSNIDSIDVLNTLLKKIQENQNINFVCFNDSTELSNDEYNKVKTKLTAYLENSFPKLASFEIEVKR